MLAGSELIGKNVPENRNSGVMPKRKIVGEAVRVLLGRRERGDRTGEGHPGQDRGRDAQHDQRRLVRPERR